MRKKVIWFEVGILLALSLGQDAIYAIVSLIAQLTRPGGLAGSTQTLNPSASPREWLDLTLQLLSIGFGLVPVALALYLLWQNGRNPYRTIGLDFRWPWQNIGRGALLAAAIGIPGVGLYLAARALGISASVVPAAQESYWWTIPVLLLAAARAALLEEVIVVAYLFDRLQRLGIRPWVQLVSTSLLRATYHLYQGFGAFVGNFVMGLVFGWAYRRWGRVMPLVIAHFILDAFAFVGYALLSPYIKLP